MRNLFIVFTPYHIKVSNYLSNSIFGEKDCINMLMVLENMHSSKEVLEGFIEYKNYFYFLSADLSSISLKILFKDYFRNKYILKNNLDILTKTITDFNPDNIIYFSDNPIPMQILLNVHENSTKFFVEEGLAMYTYNKRITVKEMITHIFYKKILKNKKLKLFCHGEGNFENVVIAREPDIIKNVTPQYFIKISREMFKKIIYTNNSLYDINIRMEKNAFLCPAGTEYGIEKLNYIYSEIFEFYISKNIKIFVKLHPSEKYINEIVEIISNYPNKVFLIEDKKVTSEDIIIVGKPSIIISDYSSTMINSVYLFENVEIVSYYGMMQQKYGIDMGFKSLLFNKLVNEGKIKQFKDYKIIV